jgi:hypothetical protein
VARASFGGGQDLSGLMASYYNQYESHLESLANQADTRARQDQAAQDNDKIDQWQSGELSDAEFLAYAKTRAADPNNDPSDTTQWNKAIRNVQAAIKQTYISTKSQEIMDGIQKGTRTYTDLLKFYQLQQKGLKTSDPLYVTLNKSIEDTKTQIDTNYIQGGMERVQYQFQAKQLTGRQAGSQLRALAARYKTNDPAKYYQILESALQMEQYGNGFYRTSSSGGGSSSGSGGGSTGSGAEAAVKGHINNEEATRKLYEAVSDQFNDGETVASVNVVDANGKVVSRDVTVRDASGNPSSAMTAIDHAYLDSIDAEQRSLVQLQNAPTRYYKNGNPIPRADQSTKIAELSKKRADWITGQIQPRNTILPDQQANALRSGLSKVIFDAADSSDPAAAWAGVKSMAQQIINWNSTVNATIKAEEARHGLIKGADMPQGSTLVGKAQEDRTTGKFLGASLAGLAQMVIAAGEPANAGKDVSAGILAAAQELGMSDDETTLLMAGVSTVQGQNSGAYQLFMIPNASGGVEPTWLPVSQPVVSYAPDGTPRLADTPIPMNPKTSAPYLVAGQAVAPVIVDVAGQARQAFGITQSVDLNGDGEILNSSVPGTSDQKVSTGSRMFLPDANGQSHAWYQTSAGWHRDNLGNVAIPLPYSGEHPRDAQTVASTTLDPKTGKVYDPTGHAFDAGIQAAWAGQDWYGAMEKASKSDQTQVKIQTGLFLKTLARRGTNENAGMFQGGGAPNPQKFGIRTLSDLAAPSKPVSFGMQKTQFADFRMPKITLAPVAPVNVNLPNLNGNTLAGIPLPTGTTSQHIAYDSLGGMIR